MKKEIFIVDDDPIYRLIVSKTIGKLDSSLPINECKNGEIGLAKLEDLKNSKHEIIVLLDINMPIVNGWEFLGAIEKYNFYNLDQLMIYMISSSIDTSDKVKADQYAFVKGFYHKPLTNEDLKIIIGID
ncbi:response regulator [Cryomorpha ignava]|uniref:Response regulator n=1 Tax=Cryomorpha ignava TaxID=101383 RepID=A0A7K3WKH3_9FLAO|nr:response regulator [Cryomorpha ignava]NEN22146.1 response regulator [Cryomorpha ignava]